ncbi:TetR/AcrR family transcriptional regulator [Spirosoma koreense]
METKKKRNRVQTYQRILLALQTVMARHGWHEVTVHMVAQEAQLSKVLIYRYFGSLDGLLQAYAQQGSVFAPLPLNQFPLSPLGPERGKAMAWTAQTRHLFRQLRTSKAKRELLKLSLRGNDDFAKQVAQSQDSQLQEFVRHLPGLAELAGEDPPAVLSIVLGGLSYLTLLAHLDRPMLGIELRSEAGWGRVEAAVQTLYQSLDTSPTHRVQHRPSELVFRE